MLTIYLPTFTDFGMMRDALLLLEEMGGSRGGREPGIVKSWFLGGVGYYMRAIYLATLVDRWYSAPSLYVPWRLYMCNWPECFSNNSLDSRQS